MMPPAGMLRMRTRRAPAQKAIMVIAACVAICGCVEKGPPATAAEVDDYFVNPAADAQRRLSSREGDTARCNAEFRAIKSAAVASIDALPGNTPHLLQEWLTDTAGLRYCMGFETPGRIKADTAYPLIIYLHGGTGTMRDNKGDSAFLMLKDLADTFTMFLASPSANRYAPWWSPAGIARILQTLRYMTLHYPINPNKVFLAGVSDGATGCYAAANTVPSPFAGFIAVSGFGGMLPELGMPLIPGNLSQRPIYNVNAGRDRIYAVEQVEQFVAALKEQGVPVIAKFYPAEEHGFDYRAREMGVLAGFIRSWSRPVSPDISWTFIAGYPNCPDNLLSWKITAPDAAVRGQLRHDTLYIRSQGVASVTAFFPDSGRTTLICRFVSEDGKVRAVSPEGVAWQDALRLMLHRCVPGFTGGYLYKIKF